VFIAINFNGSINEIEENWEKPTFFIQDGGYLFTNSMSGAARLPALLSGTNISLCDPCGIYICDIIIYVCELKQWNTPKVVYYYINYIWRICNCVLIFNFKDKVFYIVPSNKEL